MKKYRVTFFGVFGFDYEVEAPDEDAAIELANKKHCAVPDAQVVSLDSADWDSRDPYVEEEE